MQKIKSIEHLWKLLDQGVEVFWCNDSYHITIEHAYPGNDFQEKHHTFRSGKVLRVTCKANYFGSLLSEDEITGLYFKAV